MNNIINRIKTISKLYKILVLDYNDGILDKERKTHISEQLELMQEYCKNKINNGEGNV